MFKKLLIANRGEIAVRVIHAARELGINMVAVYSEADKDFLHTILADEAICIGSARSTNFYLNMNVVLSVTIVAKARAIHLGFGFLGESSRFATACEEMYIKFIGPNAEIMDKTGDKIDARAEMIAVNVPAISGSDGEVFTAEEALEVVNRLGYPVILKASAGGNDKGIRKVESVEELISASGSASQEALMALGNGAMYIEKVVYPARHIETQILGDSHDDVAHLGEHGCSPQHNNQKVLEENPLTAIGKTLRAQIGNAAIRAVKTVHYENAGTTEFLFDEKTSEFYLMEVDIRVQVEHPATKFATSIDIVKEQTRITVDQLLSVTQDDITITGHTIECRINAENLRFNFASSPNKITNLYLSSGGVGLRVDSAVYNGYSIPPYYDSVIAKIIVCSKNRFDALMKMQCTPYELEIEGITTDVEFQTGLISDEHVIAGDYDTSFLTKTLLPNYNKEND